MITIPAVFAMILLISAMWSAAPVLGVRPLTIKLAAAHEKATLRVGADVFAFLIDQSRAADGTEVPPVFLTLVSREFSFRTIHAPHLRHD